MFDEGRTIPLADAVTLVEEFLREDIAPRERAAANPPGEQLGLSPREIDVLRLMGSHSDKEIAEALSIRTQTVTTHVTRILAKMNVTSRTEAAILAMQYGIMPMSEGSGEEAQ